MSTLRISDAPLLPNVEGTEKIPTGGRGDYAVSLNQVKTFTQGGIPQQLEEHINDKSNPHQVTKEQVGLGSVDNTSDIDKPVSTETQEALDLKANLIYVDEALSSLSTQASKFYPTLAEANADIANISVNQLVNIGEASNGGLWYKATAESTSLTKSPYDPLTQAKTYTDTELNKIKTTGVGKNKYNPASGVVDKYIGSNGVQYDAVGWKHSGLIAVTAGQTYTLSANANKANGLAFYSANSPILANVVQAVASEGITATTPYTFTVPAGALYVAFNVKSASLVEPTQVQLELGSVATNFESYNPNKTSILDSALSENVVLKQDLGALTAKSYESKITSANLFDVTKDVVSGSYVGTNGSIQTASGWTRSVMLPVTAGQTYTLSGERSQFNVGFYANKTDTTAVGVVNDKTAMPLTFTVPAGANYVSFNIASASNTYYADLQLELGAVATTYRKSVGQITLLNSAYLDNHIDLPRITITGKEATLRARNGDLAITLNLILYSDVSRTASTVFNFKSENAGIVNRNLGDDVSPYGIDGTLVGANHGYGKYALTVSGHGKTNADIGSVWSDGTKEWVITRIVDANTIDVTVRARTGAIASNATLTHVSGATNTTTMTVTAAVSGQLYPSIKNRKLRMSIDGVQLPISNMTRTYKSNITFHETYEIIDKLALVEWLIANKGSEILQYGGQACASVSLDHRFDVEGGYAATLDFLALTDISSFQDIMFGQSVRFGANSFFYVPKTLPFTQGSTNYNLTNLSQVTFASIADFDSAKTEATGILADRIIQHDATHAVGFALGMLPILDASMDKRRLNAEGKALRISTAMKSYLYVVDGKTSLVAGDYFAAVIYRKHFPVLTRTAQYAVRSKRGDYLYLDWHAAVTERIDLPPDYCDRDFSIIEKSSNVSILSDTASSSIAVKVDNSKNYGYAILKFV